MADEYGPWIGWNGGECPVAEGTLVQVATATSGMLRHASAKAENYDWSHGDYRVNGPSYNVGDIIAYRVLREPVVETVRRPVHFWRLLPGEPWQFFGGHDKNGHVSEVINGFAAFETRDGTLDMTTLRWEPAE